MVEIRHRHNEHENTRGTGASGGSRVYPVGCLYDDNSSNNENVSVIGFGFT